jgi:hypothetical protein
VVVDSPAFHQAISEWNRALHDELGAFAFTGDSQLIGMGSWQMRFAEYVWEKALESRKGKD